MARFLGIVLVLVFSLASPALAQTLPDFPEPSVTANLFRIQFDCNLSDPVEDSRVRFSYSDTTPTQNIFDDSPDSTFCDTYLSLAAGGSSSDPGGGGTGDTLEVSQETLDWWQATIDFLMLTQTIGVAVYPVIFGIRVLSLIAYS